MSLRTDPALDDRAVEDLLRARFTDGRTPNDRDVCRGLEAVARVYHGGADQAAVRESTTHLEQCPVCREALALLLEAEGMATTPLPARAVWAWRARPALLAASVALVLGVAALLGWRLLGPGGAEIAQSQGTLAIKGGADTIAIAVERGTRRFRARPGDALLDGDRIGFFYSAEQSGFLTLLELNERGETAVLFPAAGGNSAPISAGSRLPLPDGGVVRQTDLCEWLVGVFSSEPLDLARVKIELAAAGRAATGCSLAPVVAGARTVWVFKVR
jgi:hypothetical protein